MIKKSGGRRSDMRKSWEEKKCNDYGKQGDWNPNTILKGDFKGETPDWQVKGHSRRLQYRMALSFIKTTMIRQKKIDKIQKKKNNKYFLKKISENYWQRRRDVVI